MAEYLHATSVVENVPQGNTIPGSDQIAAATPDGLTLGLLNPVSDASLVLTNTPGLNFNPERLGYIAENAGGASALVVSNSSPYQTFADLKNSPTPINMLTEASGSANTVLRAWMGVMGVKVHWISGYGRSARSSLASSVVMVRRRTSTLQMLVRCWRRVRRGSSR